MTLGRLWSHIIALKKHILTDYMVLKEFMMTLLYFVILFSVLQNRDSKVKARERE